MARRSNQSIPKEINTEYSLEGLMLKVKLPDFGHLMQRADSLEKTEYWGRWRAKGKGVGEDEMARQHHRLNRVNICESEQTPEDSGGQRSPASCGPQGHKVTSAAG